MCVCSMMSVGGKDLARCVFSGTGPLPGVTEPLTAAELELQSASQVSSPVSDPD